MLVLVLAGACTRSDNLIVTHDGSDQTDVAGAGGGTAGSGGAAGGSGGTVFGGGDASSGTGGQWMPDATAPEDAPSSLDVTARLDGGGGDAAPFYSSCGQIPSCAAGTACHCCPLGGLNGPSHCSCTITCLRDEECPASAPHCNVKKVSGFAAGQGLCTSPDFLCLW
jgi:hypothetical protein